MFLLYICIYNKTSIRRNILTIKQKHREVSGAKDLSASLYFALRQCGRRKSNFRTENVHQFWDMRCVLALCDFFIFVVTNSFFFF